MLQSLLLIGHTSPLLIDTLFEIVSTNIVILFHSLINLMSFLSFFWKVFLIFLNLMFLISSIESFSKRIRFFHLDGAVNYFSPYYLAFPSLLLCILSLLLKRIAFYLILVITISSFSISCNKYVFSDGIGMCLIQYPKFSFSIMLMNP